MPPTDRADPCATLIATGLEKHRAGQLAEAEALYRRALDVDPGHFDALHLLGTIAYQQGRYESAADLIGRAAARNPASDAALNNLGLAYRALGDVERSTECLERAVTLNPRYADAYNNLGLVYQAQQRHEEAVANFERAVALDPRHAQALNNLGSVLRARGRAADAIGVFERALQVAPEFVQARMSLASALAARRQRDAALAQYRTVIASHPGLAEAHYQIGALLQTRGEIDDAVRSFEQAVALDGGHVEARWAQALAQVRSIVSREPTVQDGDGECLCVLNELDAWFDEARTRNGVRAVGCQSLFWLAYEDRNNAPVLSRYGDASARLMNTWRESRLGVPSVRPGKGPVRVGIVSAHVRDHSVWTALVRGWVQHLDRKRVALTLFNVGAASDTETERARSLVERMRESTDLGIVAEDIIDSRLDVLLYPEIGMDPTTIRLAGMRLAPVQAVSWGHPETSGLPTIDYFVSAAGLEPPGAQAGYRESLVPLPNLGCYYASSQMEEEPVDLTALGLDDGRPLLVCPGTPYKYQPKYDDLYVRIAQSMHDCCFVFFRDDDYVELSSRLELRLRGAFERAGISADRHLAFVPWQKPGRFRGLLRRAKLYLDTPGFSGFNTAMQAVECELPLVALEGRFMRGRLASGILRRIGLDACVATTTDEYVRIAVQVATDAAAAGAVRSLTRERRSILYGDAAPVRALEDFFVDAARRASPSRP